MTKILGKYSSSVFKTPEIRRLKFIIFWKLSWFIANLIKTKKFYYRILKDDFVSKKIFTQSNDVMTNVSFNNMDVRGIVTIHFFYRQYILNIEFRNKHVLTVTFFEYCLHFILLFSKTYFRIPFVFRTCPLEQYLRGIPSKKII